ncbi:MAG TPA: flagellar hook basal-body protein [bacterium]|nr:flagellar hook basal-body protein [bacterium]
MVSTITQILHITRSGMLARLQDLDLVSHNLANANTFGFKSSRTNFQELLNSRRYGGVQLQATQRFMQQGSLQMTEKPLDLAIEGEGFFAVSLPDGRTAYTRDGQFHVDSDGQIVNASGNRLVWDGGQIPVDTVGVQVNLDGSVMILQAAATWDQLGTIELSRFPNPNGLDGYGQSLWLETDVSGTAETGMPGSEGLGQVVGGALEQSNVSIANEMTQIISLQRSFQMSTRAFQQTDQMLSQAINLRR